MTIPEMHDALEAAHVRWSMHRRSGDECAAKQAWDDAENLGLILFRAEEAARFEEMRRASEADWDLLKGSPDHSGISAAEHAHIHSDAYTDTLGARLRHG